MFPDMNPTLGKPQKGREEGVSRLRARLALGLTWGFLFPSPGSKVGLTRLVRHVDPLQRPDKKASNGTQGGKPEESATQYAVLAIVPVFCVMGLLGILVCNLLKKKGYHCTAHKETDEEATKAERSGKWRRVSGADVFFLPRYNPGQTSPPAPLRVCCLFGAPSCFS